MHMADQTRITLRLPTDLVRRASKLAAETGATKSALMRRAMNVGMPALEQQFGGKAAR